jgi:hypothetical protein
VQSHFSKGGLDKKSATPLTSVMMGHLPGNISWMLGNDMDVIWDERSRFNRRKEVGMMPAFKP